MKKAARRKAKLTLLALLTLVIAGCVQFEEPDLGFNGQVESVRIWEGTRTSHGMLDYKPMRDRREEEKQSPEPFFAMQLRWSFIYNDGHINKISYNKRFRNGDGCPYGDTEYLFYFPDNKPEDVIIMDYHKCRSKTVREVPFRNFDFDFNHDVDFIKFHPNIERTLNDRGDVSEVEFNARNGEAVTFNWTYEYDDMGNWIIRKLYDEGYLIQKVRRDFTYQ